MSFNDLKQCKKKTKKTEDKFGCINPKPNRSIFKINNTFLVKAFLSF